jgi:hypothetical protein
MESIWSPYRVHMESMVLHGSSTLHQKLLLYNFVYAAKIVLKKQHFGQKLIIDRAAPGSFFAHFMMSM